MSKWDVVDTYENQDDKWSVDLGYTLPDNQERADNTMEAVTGGGVIKSNINEDSDVIDALTDTALKGANFIIDGLDYFGNISRTTIGAMVRNQDVSDAFIDSLTYKRRTSSEDLRRAVGERYGINYKLSEKDGEFEAADIGDFVMDVGIDIVTDPLTYITMGASSLIKGAATKAGKQAIEEGSEKLAKESIEKLGERAKVDRSGILKEVDSTDPAAMAQSRRDLKIDEDVAGIDVDEISNWDNTTIIGVAEDIGVIDSQDIYNMSQRAAKVAKAAGFAPREAFAATMGGAYNAAANIEDESSVSDVLTNFAIGAGLTVGGRKMLRTDKAKAVAARVGKALDTAASPAKKAVMEVRDSVTGNKRTIEYDADAGIMSQLATEAGQSKRNAATNINRLFKAGMEQIKEGGSIAAGDSFLMVEKLRDRNVLLRDEIWERTLKDVPIETLRKNRLTKKTKKGNEIPVSYAEASGEGVRALKKEVQEQANARMLDNTGKISNDEIMQIAAKENIEVTDTVLKNLNIWKDTTTKVLTEEKRWIKDNLFKLKDTDSIYSQKEIMDIRRRAYNEGREINEFSDLIEMDDIKTAMDLQLDNPGLAIWSPRRATKDADLSMTVLAKNTGEPMTQQIRSKAAKSTIDNTKRDILGKKEAEKFIDAKKLGDDIQAIKHADEYIDKFETAARISAENKARNTLNTIQKEAGQFMGAVRADKSILENNTRKFNSLIKRGLLLGSYTWVKNNYWSNVRQAFAKHGVFGALDATGMTGFMNGLNKDIYNVFKAASADVPPWKFANKETAEMIDLGVIEPTHFKDAMRSVDGDELRYLMTDEQIAKQAQKESGAGFKTLDWLDRKSDSFSMVLGTKQWGSRVEALARASTYQRSLKHLRASDNYRALVDNVGKDIAEQSIKREAVDITNEVFFDYGKLRYWESSFVREIIPFYSFYKQNAAYQSKALFDPQSTAKLAQMSRMSGGSYYGTDNLTGDDRDALDQHLKKQHAFIKTMPDGTKKVHYTTSDPASQFYQMLSGEDWFKSFSTYFNPALKSVVEQLITHEDSFSGQPFDAREMSNNPDKQMRYLFSRGYPLMRIYDLIDMGIRKSESTIWTKGGNPVTDSEVVSRIDNIMSWALASYTSQAMQIWAQGEKVYRGKQSVGDMLMNLGGPMSTTQMIPERELRNRLKAEQEREREVRGPELRRRRRALGDID
jgi:hypothetical protein